MADKVRRDPEEPLKVQELIAKYDPEHRFRRLQGFRGALAAAIGVTLSLYEIYTAGFGIPLEAKHRAIYMAFTMPMIFLLYPPSKKSSLDQQTPWYDLILAALGALFSLYILYFFQDLVGRAGLPTTMDLTMGGIAIVLVLEASRRTMGVDLPLLSLAFLLYAYFGPSMPGFLAHRGYSISRIIDHMYFTTEGIYGIPLGVVATYVFHFVLFGAFAMRTGLGQLFIDLAKALTGRLIGGPAKVAIISSGFFGMISGSSVANTVGTGSLTIPMMKKIGYHPQFAAAAEATASTGGQVTPPVMGAAAFVMAEFLGIPYVKIAIAASIPALLHYVGVYTMVHLEAKKHGLRGLTREELPHVPTLLKERGHLLIPLGILVYLLMAGYTPFLAAFWAILSTAGVGFLRRETRLNLRQLLEALADGARQALSVSAACACVGFIVGVTTLTGVGFKFGAMALDLAGGIASFLQRLDLFGLGIFSGAPLFITLLLTAIACTILGSGVPTTPTYIILVIIAAPALLAFGIPPFVSHMFVFYYGVLADITPPVWPWPLTRGLGSPAPIPSRRGSRPSDWPTRKRWCPLSLLTPRCSSSSLTSTGSISSWCLPGPSSASPLWAQQSRATFSPRSTPGNVWRSSWRRSSSSHRA